MVIKGDLIEHEILSTNGQSGSPIYRKDKQTAKIVAIHKGCKEKSIKVATKVSMKMIHQIEQWSRKDFQLLPNYQPGEPLENPQGNVSALQKGTQIYI